MTDHRGQHSSRRPGETVLIGDDIEVTVMRIGGNQVRIGITAPEDVHIVREELDQEDAQVE